MGKVFWKGLLLVLLTLELIMYVQTDENATTKSPDRFGGSDDYNQHKQEGRDWFDDKRKEHDDQFEQRRKESEKSFQDTSDKHDNMFMIFGIVAGVKVLLACIGGGCAYARHYRRYGGQPMPVGMGMGGMGMGMAPGMGMGMNYGMQPTIIQTSYSQPAQTSGTEQAASPT